MSIATGKPNTASYGLNSDLFQRDDFIQRHIGPSAAEIESMLQCLGSSSLDDLMKQTIPNDILVEHRGELPDPTPEHETLQKLRQYADANASYKSFIGMGYYGTHVPNVILRNVLENPGWYTAYTPYQAEIAQGRLESLLNFQQMVMDLTAMDVSNASLLDEATAAAEAMALARRVNKSKGNIFFVADNVHPQTVDVISTRAKYFGFELVRGSLGELPAEGVFGAIVQYPGTSGEIVDIEPFINQAHQQQAVVCVACDLLSLTMLKPPGELGADIVIGNTQRFGVPMGYGGPHAAFLATRDAYKRSLPGRVIGISKDCRGNLALRMAMQTREQHIRRDKATSNICTAQALLANMAAFYAIYHGPEGLKTIATRVHRLTQLLAVNLTAAGHNVVSQQFFDTITVSVDQSDSVIATALQRKINLRRIDDHHVGISLDETTTLNDIETLAEIFDTDLNSEIELDDGTAFGLPENLLRESSYLEHPVFHRYRSETEMLRYLKSLENKDYSLTHGMIPLGSCTMKLNATAEMVPVTWPSFAEAHPFAPADQCVGYRDMISELEQWLLDVSGYDAISMQPNSGAQGEYAGLLAIRRFHESIGEGHRDICLIPSSAHGTNPASASMMGLKVVVIKTDDSGNIDMADLMEKTAEHAANLSSLMITYPSTHGVFEETIREACKLIHDAGGKVYMDGANMNALVGVTSPGAIGSDVSHMNLHKTFCIPHGGGGPGMGPIGVEKELAPFLPGHVINADSPAGAVSATPFGSAAILPISWAYIQLMGFAGLKKATEVAILNANYVAKRLEGEFNVLYKGRSGMVAHECIIDIRPIKEKTGVTEEDIAKRLMDYGFHAPTMSWPVPGTIMVEPTESESKKELDRFCDALLAIRQEIRAIEDGKIAVENSPLRHAPHTIEDITDANWNRDYSREQAATPVAGQKQKKFWPTVNRIDNVFGDRNFVCSCPPVSEYEEN